MLCLDAHKIKSELIECKQLHLNQINNEREKHKSKKYVRAHSLDLNRVISSCGMKCSHSDFK